MTSNRSRSLLGHSTLMITTFVLMLAGLVLISHGDDQFANVASAQVGSHLQIAPGTAPTAWSDSVGPSWGFDPGAPGGQTSGFVQLRSVDVTHPTTTGLTMKTVVDSNATPGFANQLIVTSMQLGNTDLLGRWSACATGTGGTLTLADLVSCTPLPGLPTPPGTDAGAPFSMTFEFDQAAGNVFQGATLSARFLFTLTDTTGDPPPAVIVTLTPTATASPTGTPSDPPSATPTPRGSATATPTSATTATPGAPSPSATNTASDDDSGPGATYTPVAPYTGSGSAGGDSGLGKGLFIAGAILLAAWLASMFLLAGKNRRRDAE